MTIAGASVLSPAARPAAAPDMIETVRAIASADLAPLVAEIDQQGLYPDGVLRKLGGAGAFAGHLPGYLAAEPDLSRSIGAMSAISELCLSTSFCMWCQNALGWYVYTSANTALRDRIGERLATGRQLGGTGLSNPMKTFFGIERLKLKARRVAGGYRVTGLLPWVSNLGSDHFFGGIFELEGNPAHRVMAVIDCAAEGVAIRQSDHFVALEGTRTYSVMLRDALIPDGAVLADPIDTYIPRIRAGFILLQAGMAFGMIRNCADIMRRERPSLGHVNRYIEVQPEEIEEHLAAMEAEVAELARTPFETSPVYFRKVVEARLAAGEATVKAAHYAMLHQGARGYVTNGAAQRRLREAYFVAIVTPATKQLRKMLSDMSH
jgi:alkylation response protein AidB-like acyl-CoA dehydrogenase